MDCSNCGGSIEYYRQRMKAYRQKGGADAQQTQQEEGPTATSLKLLQLKLQSTSLGPTDSLSGVDLHETSSTEEPQSDRESVDVDKLLDEGSDSDQRDNSSEKAFSCQNTFEHVPGSPSSAASLAPMLGRGPRGGLIVNHLSPQRPSLSSLAVSSAPMLGGGPRGGLIVNHPSPQRPSHSAPADHPELSELVI